MVDSWALRQAIAWNTLDACGEKKSLSANCPRMSAFVRGSVRETRCPRCPQAKPICNFKKKHWESEHLPLVRGETYGIRCPRDSVKTCLFPLVTQDLNNAIPMEKFGLRVLRGRVGVSDPEPSNLATEATEMEYKCVTYSRRQFVRFLDGTTSCIQFFRGQGETVQVHLQRVTQAKKNKVMQLLQFGSTSLALMR